MKPLRQIIVESVTTLRIPHEKISQVTADNLKQLHSIMRVKGFEKKSSKESALEHHTYTKDDRRITYTGWHGTGSGSRNYGNLKMGHELYDNKFHAYNAAVEFDQPRILSTSPEGEDEGHISWSGQNVSAHAASEHQKFWSKVLDYAKNI